jgi:hypothetical protein
MSIKDTNFGSLLEQKNRQISLDTPFVFGYIITSPSPDRLFSHLPDRSDIDHAIAMSFAESQGIVSLSAAAREHECPIPPQ